MKRIPRIITTNQTESKRPMNPIKKSSAVQRIENLLFASYCAFLGASPADAQEKILEWDRTCITAVQTTRSHEEMLAVLNGARSGSETEFIIFGRLKDTATTLERFVVLHHRVAEKLSFAETRLSIFSEEAMRVRTDRLKTFKEQVFDKWDEAALKELGSEASREHAQTISRLCPSGGRTSRAISSRLAAIATEEHRLAEAEKEGESGDGKVAKVG